MAMGMDKATVRKEMRARRKAVPVEVRNAVSHAICETLLARADVRRAFAERRPVAVYLASPDEIDLTEFVRVALGREAVLEAPRWNGTFYELAPLTSFGGLVPGPHGILEPPSPAATRPLDASTARPAVWLVPGLAFTRAGGRLGYGGGWYDRFLAEADESSSKIGVAYGFQLMDELPVEPHDVPLTDIVCA